MNASKIPIVGNTLYTKQRLYRRRATELLLRLVADHIPPISRPNGPCRRKTSFSLGAREELSAYGRS
jgi:hypothetical protein